MSNIRGNKWFSLLAGYYGLLQTMHIIFLSRAGLLVLQTGRVPFPAAPPPGGWNDAVLPFLMGMAAADVVAACLGIYFSYSQLIKKRFKPVIGIISLTIALSSAVVYLVGTLPSGAWIHNPISYLIVILAFLPIIPLYILLVSKSALKMEVL